MCGNVWQCNRCRSSKNWEKATTKIMGGKNSFNGLGCVCVAASLQTSVLLSLRPPEQQWVDHWSLHAHPKHHPCKHLHAPQGAGHLSRCTLLQFHLHRAQVFAPAGVWGTSTWTLRSHAAPKWWVHQQVKEEERRAGRGVRRDHGRVNWLFEKDAHQLLLVEVDHHLPRFLLLGLLLPLLVPDQIVCWAHKVASNQLSMKCPEICISLCSNFLSAYFKPIADWGCFVETQLNTTLSSGERWARRSRPRRRRQRSTQTTLRPDPASARSLVSWPLSSLSSTYLASRGRSKNMLENDKVNK